MAFRSARGESLRQPSIRKTLQRAIYPPEAQSLFHHLYVWYSLPFWAFAPIGHHPTTLLPIVVLFQPLAKFGAIPKVEKIDYFHDV